MPGRRSGAEGRLGRALSALARGLEASGAPWMIIGGIAVITRGVRRLTTDIDAVVRGDAVTARALLAALAKARIQPRIPRALAFADKNLVLLLRHEPTGVDLDVSLGWSAFEHEALDARTSAEFAGVRAYMATPDDLVVFKAVAARPRDLEDAEALLLLHPEVDLARARRRVGELAELAGVPEMSEGFERVAARARRTGKRPRR